jgi:hypothetical protein
MGVYIFKSKHGDYVKVGHYAKTNPWSRVSKRGFYSCICPDSIQDKVSVDDLDLRHWFPNLSTKHEKEIHNIIMDHKVCGEWFYTSSLIELLQYLNNLDNDVANTCSREAAINSRYRL